MLNWLIILLLDQEVHDNTALGPGGTRGGKWTLLSSQSALFYVVFAWEPSLVTNAKEYSAKVESFEKKKGTVKTIKIIFKWVFV